MAACLGSAAPAIAQLRDPTEPARVHGATAATAHDPLEQFRPQHIVTVDGKRVLVWHGRRYAVGDRLEGARIERIDESEVWLRDSGGLRKLARYPGVEKIAKGRP